GRQSRNGLGLEIVTVTVGIGAVRKPAGARIGGDRRHQRRPWFEHGAGGPGVHKSAIVEAVGNPSRGIPQHHAALFDDDVMTELRRRGGQFRSSKPLVGLWSALVSGSLDRGIPYNV